MKKFSVVKMGLIAVAVGGILLALAGQAISASLESGSVTANPVTLYFRNATGTAGTTVTPVSTSNPIPVSSGVESKGSWTTARTSVVANDTATTYGTGDTGNFSVSGYKHVRFRIFMNATADSMSFACGSATPVTNPYYGYTPTVTVSGYSTTSPFTCSCDTNGQTVMFPRVTGLSSGGNVTAIKYQAYN